MDDFELTRLEWITNRAATEELMRVSGMMPVVAMHLAAYEHRFLYGTGALVPSGLTGTSVVVADKRARLLSSLSAAVGARYGFTLGGR